MSLKTVALAALCLTSFASSAGAYTFILHPRVTATGGAAVDIRFTKKAIFVAESTSVTCTKDRTTARVVYVAKGTKITVVGQFVGLTKDGDPQFDIKQWDLPGRDSRPRQ